MAAFESAETSRPVESRMVKGALPLDVAGGVIAGQIAGLIMAVVVMAVFTLFLGKGPLYPVQVIGSFVFGEEALSGIHVPAVIAGLVLHQLGPSLFWGTVFGALAHALALKRGPALATVGVLVGIASQVIDAHLILPAAFTALHGQDLWAREVPVGWSWAAHVVFGISLLTFPLARRWAARLPFARE